jgi:hypothetical protein
MYLKKAISGHMASRKLFPVTWKKPSNNHMIKLSAVKEILSVPCPKRAGKDFPLLLCQKHTVKKGKFFCTLADYGLTYDG